MTESSHLFTHSGTNEADSTVGVELLTSESRRLLLDKLHALSHFLLKAKIQHSISFIKNNMLEIG